MLVLALQFSKGSGRGRTFDISSNGAHRGQRERELRAGAEVEDPNGSAPSKRKRRQSESNQRVKRINLRLTAHSTDPPVHQLGVVRTG